MGGIPPPHTNGGRGKAHVRRGRAQRPPHPVHRVGRQRHQLLARGPQAALQLLGHLNRVHAGVDAHAGARWQGAGQPLVHLQAAPAKAAHATRGRQATMGFGVWQ